MNIFVFLQEVEDGLDGVALHPTRRHVPRHRSGNRYLVLADYMALTSREIDLTEDETVELIKVITVQENSDSFSKL